MHILMLGAGAMGSLFGARLSRTENRVTLLDVNSEHIRSIRDKGLVLQELDGSEHTFPVSCTDSPEAIQSLIDLVIVMVKSPATEAAVNSVRPCCSDATLFLTLQNGIGHWERISALVGQDSVVAGVTAQGATLLGPGKIRHGGNGPTHIGEINGPISTRVAKLVELLLSAGLQTYASDRMEQLIWEKLLVNTGINAITALTGMTNGRLTELEPARELCRSAVEEAAAVGRARGIRIANDIVDRVLSVARATARNRSSMGQDLDRKKATEINAINGAIVEYGQAAGIPTPINRTLTQLIKIVEATSQEKP